MIWEEPRSLIGADRDPSVFQTARALSGRDNLFPRKSLARIKNMAARLYSTLTSAGSGGTMMDLIGRAGALRYDYY